MLIKIEKEKLTIDLKNQKEAEKAITMIEIAKVKILKELFNTSINNFFEIKNNGGN